MNTLLDINRRLHLGCGRDYRAGWTNVDCVRGVPADVHHDFESMPWPFDDNSIEWIEMRHVLEHLSDTLAALAEIHRILVLGGHAHIIVPYAGSHWAFQDPTHKAFFTERTLDYVTEGFDYNFYTGVRFKIRRARLSCGSKTIAAKVRNCIPGRRLLRWFLWNMYDEVDFLIQKA